jgi:hypothetical protein|tara:strand:+ start:1308 stop:1427 length:120 start_codon:yes stop_codon:yes gene_type:complete
LVESHEQDTDEEVEEEETTDENEDYVVPVVVYTGILNRP